MHCLFHPFFLFINRSAQACIVGSLRKHFPDLSVIGEEGEECSEGRAEWLHSNQSEEVLQCSGRVPERLRDVIDEDVTVWVDPLDGTAEYTQGLLDHVTVLVGECCFDFYICFLCM